MKITFAHLRVRAALFAIALAACAGDRRDVLADPSTASVSRSPEPSAPVDASAPSADAASRGAEGYLYVARRPNGLIALAEARNVPNPAAFAMIEHLASTLEACASDLQDAGHWGSGALRLSIEFEAGGAVGATRMQVSPGTSALANGLLCIVRPAKELALPPADRGVERGISIDATWGAPDDP